MNRSLVFTANDRPHYFTAVMDSWVRVRGFRDWRPTVYLEPSLVWETMDDIASRAGAFGHLNASIRGVLSNPWHALNTAFEEGADFTVLAEDDVLVSTDILEYFTWAADRFRDKHVLAVCANTQAPSSPPAAEQHVEHRRWFTPLVWGTWSDRWRQILRDTWDHDYSSGTPEGPQSGWDWNINLRILGTRTVVAPLASRSTHIGEHGGTHMQPADFPASTSPTFTADRPSAPFTVIR